jgi:Cu(I)/Ag(I) efflux system protein CusF
MKIASKITLAAVLAFAAALPAGAQQANANATMSDGEIKKVDKEAGKITVRHGELKNLGMPPMTMVFRAGSPAMLDQVKDGDKVRFVAEKVNGALTLVRLEAAH